MKLQSSTPKLTKHYTASVWILTDTQPRKILLVHHKKYDNWIQPGGHQEPWENPLETAIREAREETGIDVAPYLPAPTRLDGHTALLPQPAYVLEAKVPAYGDQPEHYHIDIEYVVHLPEQLVQHAQRESHNIGWFTLDQLDDLPMFDNVRMVLKQELAQ
jgi:8-oxo-dGTP pyrophosphatase MutT (NUDIX family)